MLKDLEEELTKMTEDEIKKYHKRAKIKTFAVGSLTALGIIVAAIATDSPLPLVFVPYTCLMGMSTYTPQRDLIKNELNRRNLEYTK
ncbi:MAG TPA: hypothetical protein VJ343_01140 [archaeon]|nr:hypothetical protein [archaeon]